MQKEENKKQIKQTIKIHNKDCIKLLKELPGDSIDSIVSDPPYGLSAPPNMVDVLTAWIAGEPFTSTKKGFMGNTWDSFVPGPEVWKECFRVLKPGGHILIFAGSRTVDLMGLAIRLGGFEIRDQIQWLYAEGFPKSHNISKALDKAMGEKPTVIGSRKLTGNAAITTKEKGGTYASNTSTVGVPAKEVPITRATSPETQTWEGWGTALKPAHEPVILARKPVQGTIAQNVLEHGTGGLNIDACRVPGTFESGWSKSGSKAGENACMSGPNYERPPKPDSTSGRFPANVILDETAGRILDAQTGERKTSKPGKVKRKAKHDSFHPLGKLPVEVAYGDTGGASRFYKLIKETPCSKTVSTAKQNSSQKKTSDVFVQKLAQIWDPQEVTLLSECLEHFTNATQRELNKLNENVTQLMKSIAPRSLPECKPISFTETNSLATIVVQKTLTGIIQITASHWKSNGCADPVTLNITLKSLEPGESAYRFKYCPKAAKSEREKGLEAPEGERANTHPTVKPLDLMRYLVRLVTPPGGTVLDPFVGSGTTAIAAKLEGFSFVGSELSKEFTTIAKARLRAWKKAA